MRVHYALYTILSIIALVVIIRDFNQDIRSFKEDWVHALSFYPRRNYILYNERIKNF
jgi:hypothetical protein